MKLVEIPNTHIYSIPPGQELKEIRNQTDIDAYNKTCKEQAGHYVFVSVWNCQARLAIAEIQENGNMTITIVEDYDDDTLVASVEEAGGFINHSGWYPLSEAGIEKLKYVLGHLSDESGRV